MPNDESPVEAAELELRHQLAVTPERAFAAWTDPKELLQWWGPKHVRCIGAEMDLRVGGRYRIGNELPDKSVLWIEGEFEVVEPPRRLEYSWSSGGNWRERVIVRFEPNDDGTEIIIRHLRIPSAELRDDHRLGWLDCLDGLAAYLRRSGSA